MGFDDLEAAEQDRPDKQNDETAETQASETESEPDAATSASAETPTSDSVVEGAQTADSGSDDASSSGSEASDTPAFEYDDVKQSPMYARPEAWTALEDALDLDVVRSLREAGIRNEEKRELHDAVLRVAADHPDEIADAVREARESGE